MSDYVPHPHKINGIAWGLMNDDSHPTIQRIDDPDDPSFDGSGPVFGTDAEACEHVCLAAAFDMGPEGDTARDRLRYLIEWGERAKAAIPDETPPRRQYSVHITYRAVEGFTVLATSPEEAARLVMDGDPSDDSVPGDRDFDEYLGVDKVDVFEDGGEEPVFVI